MRRLWGVKLQLSWQNAELSRLVSLWMERPEAKGDTEEKLACQDSAAAPASPPAAPPGWTKTRLSAGAPAFWCHMFILISLNKEQEMHFYTNTHPSGQFVSADSLAAGKNWIGFLSAVEQEAGFEAYLPQNHFFLVSVRM